MDVQQKRRRRRRRALALLIGLGLPLAVGELAARVLVGAPLAERLPILSIRSNAARGWQMLPGEPHYTYQHRVRVNALGLRGDEVQPKAAGERRVLALGDSLIYGQGVADTETVPAYLELALNREAVGGARWDVVNAGHRAYDTRQELALLEELEPTIDPDVVVLFYFWNDVHERDIAATAERLRAKEPVTFDTGGRVEGLAWWRWQGLQLLRRSALVMVAHDLFMAPGNEPNDPAYVDAAMQRLQVYLDRFVSLSESLGFRLVFAAIPDANTLQGVHPSAEIVARAEALARARGLPVVDLLPPLQALTEEGGRLPILPFDGHYRPAANRVIAETVAEALEPLMQATSQRAAARRAGILFARASAGARLPASPIP